MFAQPAKQSTSTLPPTTHENPKQVTTIAVHVSTTVHTVIEPWPPGSPIESRSAVRIYAEYPAPPRVSVDESEEGHITISRVGVHD